MTRVQVPAQGGAYRWYSADVVAGDYTALFAFMLGSVFSGRYAASHKKGGSPREHAAVHVALYEKGVRVVWVVNEFQDVAVEAEGRTLRLGGSFLTYRPDGFTMHVASAQTAWAAAVEATLDFTTASPLGAEQSVVNGLVHRWQPLCVRGTARLVVPSWELDLVGLGSHDSHAGDVPLGAGGLSGFDRIRTHREAFSSIRLRPWGAPTLVAEVREGRLAVSHEDDVGQSARSNWGLSFPATLGVGGAPTVLESSPFYARLEASEPGAHVFAEVADFERFHGTSGARAASGKAVA
ncbi:MAG: carotenoid 1,2-hydratase [Myxococcaceae bacterium]|jgi:carotenoid 1,2-hydratase|nr:carotenoid 1,2-hydratase [Myxococcaceae bacterium]